MARKSKIAIVSLTPIQTDGRVLRQITYLSQHFEIDVIGYGQLDPAIEGKVRMIPIQRPSNFARRGRKTLLMPLGKWISKRFYEYWYRHEKEYVTTLQTLLDSKPDAIQANDWESLPLAVRAAEQTGTCVVLDLHEYAPLMHENRWYWKTFYKPSVEYFLHKYLSRASATLTINQTIADRYAREYDINPLVILNAPALENTSTFKQVNPEQIHLVHHGHSNRDRKLELMIQALALTEPRYVLHLMLIERSKNYIANLKALAQDLAPRRVFFHDPVRPVEIASKISEFDMGIFLLPAETFNQFAVLPNKFFEFIMAGLAVCIGPSPEMARLTEQFNLGLIAPSFEPKAVAERLNQLRSADINQMKQNAIEAREILNADVELGKLVKLYTNLLGGTV